MFINSIGRGAFYPRFTRNFFRYSKGIPPLKTHQLALRSFSLPPTSSKKITKAISYEILDHPLIAAETSLHLLQQDVANKEMCTQKIQTLLEQERTHKNPQFFDFLENLDRTLLVKLQHHGETFKELLLLKDATRMCFEEHLHIIKAASPRKTNTTCFVCFALEANVENWLSKVFVPDLTRIGIEPVYGPWDLSHDMDLNAFQSQIRHTDLALIVCTPGLKKKCTERVKAITGCVQEVRIALERYNDDDKQGTLFTVLLHGKRKDCIPTPILEPIFAAKFEVLNNERTTELYDYYSKAFRMFASLAGIPSKDAGELKEAFIETASTRIFGNGLDAQVVRSWSEERYRKGMGELGKFMAPNPEPSVTNTKKADPQIPRICKTRFDAEHYLNLAQKNENAASAVGYIKKALSYFKKTDPGLHYAHFLEKMDRKFLVRLVEQDKAQARISRTFSEKIEPLEVEIALPIGVDNVRATWPRLSEKQDRPSECSSFPRKCEKSGLEPILLEKDAVRMTFEKILVHFAKLPSIPTCFICCNPQEEEVVSWVHHVLASDLEKIGVRPIYAQKDLSHTGDYKSFQAQVRTADRIIIVCTPALKEKCTPGNLTGVAQEIRLARERYNQPEPGISLLYKQGNRASSCPDPVFEPIFAGEYAHSDHPIEKNVSNYYEMAFEFFAPMKKISNREALRLKEHFIDEVHKILAGQINKNEVEQWKAIRFTQIEMNTLEALQKIYARIENTQPHLLIQEDLRMHYASKKYLSLLVSQKEIPIEQLYTRLAIIGEAEKKKKKTEAQEAKNDHSLGQIEDQRPLVHESFFEPKQALLLEELFKHDQLKGATKRILIQGSAGIGKSTLCHHIAYRWAQKTLFKEFEYLLWLPLHRLDKNNMRLMQNPTWHDYVAHECGLESAQARALFSNEANQKKTLVLLDGYDELSSDATNPNGCFYPILKVLKEFPNVIITSRPREIGGFTKNCDLELLGFDSQGIKEYIEHFFSEDQQETANQVRILLQQPLVKSLAHIPINLEIFCSLAIADLSLFDSADALTTTSIYIKLTDWLFKRFRIERNHKDPDQVRTEPEPDGAYEIRPQIQVIEKIAWEAMELNTMYLPIKLITKIFRSIEQAQSVKIGIESISSVGPLRIENGEGVFIHFTFQEYFAATYLAHLYQGNPQEAKKLLEKIKFEPRFQPVLKMAAGCLSQKVELKDLQLFFNDLYSEPRDLAESYELTLFAQCFEECLPEHLEQIDQYEGFITSAISYIHKAPVQEMKFQLLRGNTKLLCNPNLMVTILDLISPISTKGWTNYEQERTRTQLMHLLSTLPLVALEVLRTLVKMASHSSSPDANVREKAIKAIQTMANFANVSHLSAPQVLIELVKIATNSSLDKRLIGEAIKAIAAVAKLGQALPFEALNALRKAASNPSLYPYYRQCALEAISDSSSSDSSVNRIVQRKAIETPVQVTGTRQALPQAVVASLEQMLSDSSQSQFLRLQAIQAVAGQALPQELPTLLVKMINNSNLAEDVRLNAIAGLAQIADMSYILPQEAVIALIKIAGNFFTDSSLPWRVQTAAIDALEEIAAEGQALSQEVQASLVKIASDSSGYLYIRLQAIQAMIHIAKVAGQALPQEVLTSLVKIASNPSLSSDTQVTAIDILVKIAATGQVLPQVAYTSMVKVAGDSSANPYYRLQAMRAAVHIVKAAEEALPPEVLTALVKIINNSNLAEQLRKDAIMALAQIAGMGYILPQEAVIALIKIAGNFSIGEHKSGSCQSEAIQALGRIAGAGQALPQDALVVLTMIVSDSSLTKCYVYFQREAAEALGHIVSSGQTLPSETLRALERIIYDSSFDWWDVRCKALSILNRLESSHLIKQPDSLVREICYLTHRAYVISEHQVSITDSSRRIVQSTSGCKEDSVRCPVK